MLSLRVDGNLSLELLEGRHAPLLYHMVDANRAHLRRWLPWLDLTACLEDSRRWIDHAREQYANREAVNLGIWHRHELAGVIGLDTVDWGNRTSTMGYWLAASCQGQGLCTRACRALVGHALGDMGLNRVEIHCAPDNLRSRAIPMRLGFTLEGRLRQAEWLYDHFVDHDVFGLLAADNPGADPD
jgi:ribosomal-protein-serine acetyltransferase